MSWLQVDTDGMPYRDRRRSSGRILEFPAEAFAAPELARWRMLLAARRLRECRDSVAAVAEAVGYDSPAAFQRSFVRCMGTTPARWRRGGDAHDSSATASIM